MRTACVTAFVAALFLAAAPAVADEPADDADNPDPAEEFEGPPGQLAFAEAFYDPDTDVKVLGNLEEEDRWTLHIGGYHRIGFTHIQADEDHELFGRNDGFALSDARLSLRGQMDNGLGFITTLDAGARLMRTTPDSPVEELAVRLTDAYVYYAPLDHFLEFNLGQFKAPFDAEDLISTADMLFINRSVANRGVQDVEGFNVAGMTQDRQIGLQARGSVPFIDIAGPEGDDEPLGISYAAALTNGNGPNVSMNENSRFAGYGRLALTWGDIVSLGGAAFYNPRTFGDPPDMIDRNISGWTADVQANLMGFSLLANVVSETREVPEIEQDPETTGLGYQVQVAYEEPFFGIQPAYRFAFYDPTEDHGGEGEDDLFEDDALTYHTIGLNYNARDYPLRLMANYTLKFEEEARQLDNDQLDLMLQLQW